MLETGDHDYINANVVEVFTEYQLHLHICFLIFESEDSCFHPVLFFIQGTRNKKKIHTYSGEKLFNRHLISNFSFGKLHVNYIISIF